MDRANSMKMVGRQARRAALAAAAVGLVTAVGAGGCSGRTARYNPTYSSDPYASASSGYGASGVGAGGGGYATAGGAPAPGASAGASGLLQNADRVLRQQGYQPVGNTQRAFQENETFSFPMLTQPGSCYTVLAVGDAGAQDVDLQVIAPSGNSMGNDNNTDTHPNVSFCPYEYGVHLARVNMFRGAGNVYFMVYQGAQGTVGNVAAAFNGGGEATPVATAPGQPDPGTGSRIQAVQQQLVAAGYQPAGQLAGRSMHNQQTDNLPVTLAAGWCYAFATFGGPGVNDSDIFVYDGTGAQQLSGDAGASADAIVQNVCPTTTGTYQLRERLYSGNGTVWFLPMARRNTAITPTNTTATVTQTPVNINTSGATAGGGGVDGVFRGVERDLISRGYRAMSAPVARTLAARATSNEAVQLEANNCYAIVAVGDSTVRDLDMSVVDASNHEIDRDLERNARPIVRVCPTTTGQYAVRMNMVDGEGPYKLGVFRWAGGTSGAGMAGLLFVRNSELTRMLQADGYQADTDFDLVRGRIRQGASTQRSVGLHAGTCYAFIAVGGDGVSDLNLGLQEGRSTVSSDNTLSAFPEVRYCARNAGNYQVVIRSASGSGEFVFRVFRQAAPTATGARGGGPAH